MKCWHSTQKVFVFLSWFGVETRANSVEDAKSSAISEKVAVPKYKQSITFQGQGYTSTAIVWNDTAKSSNGTFYSGSVQVFSNNFVAKNKSFMNVAPIPSPGDIGAQAAAIRISGDQAVFLGCGFFGAQDTLHDDRGRHYFKDCYIQGSIDFIFGPCKVTWLQEQIKGINGAVTAHGRTSKDENTGFAFVNCTLGGTGRIWLGLFSMENTIAQVWKKLISIEL
ncbi:hypothetical protein POTOM_024506 [Populus tomentosa]|uniref:Pectinesterase n=1 Tax=Populus tomentosa TaxID=118781 RepID=A0A8X8CW98_POPTO|nr:hypothetical protein POTOM_024506 [Populus tomentosa]